jgi:hypothetical protein
MGRVPSAVRGLRGGRRMPIHKAGIHKAGIGQFEAFDMVTWIVDNSAMSGTKPR